MEGLECIISDKVFGNHRFIKSNGNISVLFNKEECFIGKDKCFFFLEELEDEKKREISEDFIEDFKQNSLRLAFEREILTKEWSILFYTSELAYVLISFDKKKRFVAPFSIPYRPFGESQFKQFKEFKDKVFADSATQWRDCLEEKIQEGLEKKRRIELYGGERRIKKEIGACNDFVFECLKCGDAIYEEYDTRRSVKAVCGNCGAVINISAEAEVEIHIELEKTEGDTNAN